MKINLEHKESIVRMISALLVAVLVTGCAAVEKYPSKRPVTAEAIHTIGKANVAVAENNQGVTKGWFMTDSSAAGAQYGLLGAIVTATMDAIINSGPEKRAKKAASEVYALYPPETLNSSLVAQLKLVASEAPASADGISFGDISTVQKIQNPAALDGVIEISTSYVLAEDASALRFTAHVVYQDKNLKYSTPYKFKGSVPTSELSGPVYANDFTYYSTQLPVPTLTDDLKDRLIAAIENTYRTESGELPSPSTQDGKAMAKELEAARDAKLTKDEVAIFLTREWLKDGGSMLRHEIENAHTFAARYIAKDLNFTAVPSVDGADELLETLPDNRTVRRIGGNSESGSYVSSPGDVSSFTTYGNVMAIAPVQLTKVQALKDRAKTEALKGKNKKKS